jgi:hypothetical protein
MGQQGVDCVASLLKEQVVPIAAVRIRQLWGEKYGRTLCKSFKKAKWGLNT